MFSDIYAESYNASLQVINNLMPHFGPDEDLGQRLRRSSTEVTRLIALAKVTTKPAELGAKIIAQCAETLTLLTYSRDTKKPYLSERECNSLIKIYERISDEFENTPSFKKEAIQ